MKKMFLTMLVAVAVATSSFAAGTSKVSAFALRNFQTQFGNAANVEWATGDDYVKASFSMDNKKMEAFYNIAGDLIGTSHSISLDEVPVRAKRAFAKKFGSYTIKEAIRCEFSNEGAYFISAENEQQSVIVKVSDAEQISIFKTTKK